MGATELTYYANTDEELVELLATLQVMTKLQEATLTISSIQSAKMSELIKQLNRSWTSLSLTIADCEETSALELIRSFNNFSSEPSIFLSINGFVEKDMARLKSRNEETVERYQDHRFNQDPLNGMMQDLTSTLNESAAYVASMTTGISDIVTPAITQLHALTLGSLPSMSTIAQSACLGSCLPGDPEEAERIQQKKIQ